MSKKKIYYIIILKESTGIRMAKLNLLQWLYKHSPVNFYSMTKNNETIIKSINNTFSGYKFDYVFSHEQIDKVRPVIKHFKRFSTISILVLYLLIIYGIYFPNIEIFETCSAKIKIVVTAVFGTFFLLFIISKLFEMYLTKNFGEFTKTHFPSSDFIETQSYKEFKFELVKIFILFLMLCMLFVLIGSPYRTTIDLILKGKYNAAIRMSTVWSKIIPVDSKWYSLRGFARFYTQDYEGAIEDYNKAYELDNDEFKPMHFDNKIFIRYFMKDYNTALKEFDEELKKTEDDGEKNSLLWDKAQFLYNIGKLKEALKLYDILIERAENDRIYLMENRLYYERGLVYQKMGRLKDYQKDLQTAKELNYDVDFSSNIPQPVILLDNEYNLNK